MSDLAPANRALADLLVGLGSAAGLFFGTILLAGLLGAFGDPDHVFVQHFADTGNRAQDLAGSALLVIGGLLFIPFILGITARVWPSSGNIQATVRSLTIVITALVCVAAAALSAVDFSRLLADVFNEDSQPFGGDQAAVLPQLGYMILLLAAAYLSAVVVATLSVAALRRGGLNRGTAWVGLAASALLLLSPAVLPFIVLPAWILLAAVTTWAWDGSRAQRSGRD
ncbi:MAG TPA: hypothetical protein VIW01_03005 [Dehalococcoidia bacterium]